MKTYRYIYLRKYLKFSLFIYCKLSDEHWFDVQYLSKPIKTEKSTIYKTALFVILVIFKHFVESECQTFELNHAIGEVNR